MKCAARAIRLFFLFIWELPQNLTGAVVWLCVRRRILSREIVGGRMLFRVPDFGVSLGSFIFWSAAGTSAEGTASRGGRPDNRAHELGHSIQSAMLGPLYLIAVGIPSVARYSRDLLHRRRHGVHWAGYFDGYPENWADRLGERNASAASVPGRRGESVISERRSA
jgi:hypothetical protein